MNVKDSIWSHQKQGFRKKKKKSVLSQMFLQTFTKIRNKSPLNLPYLNVQNQVYMVLEKNCRDRTHTHTRTLQA